MPIGFALAAALEGAVGLHELLLAQTAIGVPLALAALAVPAVREIRRGAARVAA